MTVKELEAILCTVKNKDLPVVMNGYYTYEVNGYYYDKKDDEDEDENEDGEQKKETKIPKKVMNKNIENKLRDMLFKNRKPIKKSNSVGKRKKP